MSEWKEQNIDEIPQEEESLLNVNDDEEEGESSTLNKIVDVVLTNKHPNLQGFGLDISGGTDRPYVDGDNGIFVSALREKGLAEKSAEVEVGDKILEVNGACVLEVKHEEAVKLFIADRSKVELRLQKNYGLLLRAASLTPSPTPSPCAGQVTPSSEIIESPRKEKKQPGYHNSLSVSGFVIGVAVGCVCVVLLRRYLTRPNT